MEFMNTKYKIIAVVDNEKYCTEAKYPLLREMLEKDHIIVNEKRISVHSIEVSANEEIVYFYGDLVY